MKTLYISDLDGTLIRSNEMISEYTANTVNRFVERGGLFSYATARSLVTAEKVTKGLNAPFPVICYNGSFILNNATHEIIRSHYLGSDDVQTVQKVLIEHEVFPIVYAYINGAERFSFLDKNISSAMQFFLDSRLGDIRRREVQTQNELYTGDVFYFSCMDDASRLAPVNDIFGANKRFHCIYQKDIYSGEQWCELLPAKATKAHAALELKKLLGCDRLVVFGDGRNDIPLFSVADEKYAMANAVPELKTMATDVIGSNDEDGVAKWLEANAR